MVTPMRQVRRSRTNLICRIDVSAFLSIQIVLLVMFMVRASDYPDLPVFVTDDPKVFNFERMPRANREDAIVLSVLRNGDIFLRYTRSSGSELPNQIRTAISHGSERKVYIHADAHARYRDVRAVLYAVPSSGVENVAFFVSDKKEFQSLK